MMHIKKIKPVDRHVANGVPTLGSHSFNGTGFSTSLTNFQVVSVTRDINGDRIVTMTFDLDTDNPQGLDIILNFSSGISGQYVQKFFVNVISPFPVGIGTTNYPNDFEVGFTDGRGSANNVVTTFTLITRDIDSLERKVAVNEPFIPIGVANNVIDLFQNYSANLLIVQANDYRELLLPGGNYSQDDLGVSLDATKYFYAGVYNK